jgi:hypothetical protein
MGSIGNSGIRQSWFAEAIRLAGMRLPAGPKMRGWSLKRLRDCGQKQIRKHDDHHGIATTPPWLGFIVLEPSTARSRVEKSGPMQWIPMGDLCSAKHRRLDL